LSDNVQWDSFSNCAQRTATEFDYDRASKGILEAFAYLSTKP
jgi:hypothetical protein